MLQTTGPLSVSMLWPTPVLSLPSPLPLLCQELAKKSPRCDPERQTQQGMIYVIVAKTGILTCLFFRSLCSQEWCKQNPRGTTIDFKNYFDSLSLDALKVVDDYQLSITSLIMVMLLAIRRSLSGEKTGEHNLFLLMKSMNTDD